MAQLQYYVSDTERVFSVAGIFLAIFTIIGAVTVACLGTRFGKTPLLRTSLGSWFKASIAMYILYMAFRAIFHGLELAYAQKADGSGRYSETIHDLLPYYRAKAYFGLFKTHFGDVMQLVVYVSILKLGKTLIEQQSALDSRANAMYRHVCYGGAVIVGIMTVSLFAVQCSAVNDTVNGKSISKAAAAVGGVGYTSFILFFILAWASLTHACTIAHKTRLVQKTASTYFLVCSSLFLLQASFRFAWWVAFVQPDGTRRPLEQYSSAYYIDVISFIFSFFMEDWPVLCIVALMSFVGDKMSTVETGFMQMV